MNLLPYDFQGSALRVLKDERSAPWFIAKDVCDILGTQTRDVRKILDADEVDTLHLNPEQGGRPSLVISESGLYGLILRSRKRAAKAFKRWITGEVIPSIMRTGKYAFSNPLAEIEAVPRDTVADYLRQHLSERLSMEEVIQFGSIVRRLNQGLGISYEHDHVPGLGKVRTYALEILDQGWTEFQKRRRVNPQLELGLFTGQGEEAA